MTGKKDGPRKYGTELPLASFLWWVYLAAAFILLLTSFSRLDKVEIKTHEEQISYETFRAGLEEDTDVKLNAVSARVLNYTFTTEYISGETDIEKNMYGMGTRGWIVEYYAYLLLTAEDGTEAAAVRHITRMQTDTPSVLSISVPSFFIDENESIVDNINRQGGTVYGKAAKNMAGEQTFCPLTPITAEDLMSFEYMAQEHSAREAAKYDAFEMYDDGEAPLTRTITDPEVHSTNPKAVAGMAVGGLLAIFGVIMCFVYFGHITAKPKSADRKSPIQATGPSVPHAKPREEPDAPIYEDAELRLTAEKAARDAEVNRAMQSLIPNWGKNGTEDIAVALLKSDPQKLQARIRKADLDTLNIFMQRLTTEKAGRFGQDLEILSAVQRFTGNVIVQKQTEHLEQ